MLRIEVACADRDQLGEGPLQSTTSLTFGGANLDVAYVTSMARPMNGQYHREREAGCLFAIHGLGVRGLPESRFAG